MMKFGFVFAVMVLLFSGTGTAQIHTMRFENLSVNEGLSQGNVSALGQDKFGFIWIGTEDGLNMYDGYTFRVFRNDIRDTTSISDNSITSIVGDINNNLWIGTKEGLNFYNREADRFERYISRKNDPGSLSNGMVKCVFIDSKSNLWVGTEHGLNLYDPQTKKFKHFFHKAGDDQSLVNSSVKAIVEDGQHQLWIGTAKGLSLLNPDQKTFTNFLSRKDDPTTLSSDAITCLFVDKEQTLWVGTMDNGLNKKMPAGRGFIRYVHDDANTASISNNYIYHIAQDAAGKLWIGTDGGLIGMNTVEDSFALYDHNPRDRSGISNNTISVLMIDVNDRLWLGTRYAGVNVYDKNRYSFNNYKFDPSSANSIGNDVVSHFEEDKNGNFWVATDGGGLSYLDRKSNQFTSYGDIFTNKKILAIEKDADGGLWLGMWRGGLNYYNRATKKVKKYRHHPSKGNSLSDDNVFYIRRMRNGDIWVGTWGNGVSKYNRKTDDFTRFTNNPDDTNSIASSGIAYLLEDSNGLVWIGTEGNGVDRYDPATNIFTHFKASAEAGALSNNFVTTIFEDTQKRIWVGTYRGLNLFDPATQTFKSYHVYDGMPNEAVVGIQEDGAGKLWVSTNFGITCFDPVHNNFKNYTVHDGLPGSQFNRWASAKLSTGELLFGGTEGFTLFHPDSMKVNTIKPPVYITGFRVLNKPVMIGENEILKKNILCTSEIELSYLDNVISFEFAALNYLEADKNRYRYKMEGFQDEWIEAGNERKATYTNLAPGEYRFRVIAANNSSVWNEQGAAVKIVITPPYWRTWWFRTLLAVVVVGGIASFVMARNRHAAKLKATLEEQIQKSTEEIMGQKEALVAQTEDMQTLNEQLQGQTIFLQQINNELEKQREEAENARREAEKANQAKSIFLATMSHEIRTPMNGVLGMASLLAETPLTTEQKEYADTIRGSGEALLRVINDILDFSKIESGNLELDSHTFDLRQCVEEVMDVFSTKAAQKGLDLVYQIDYQIPAQIISDSHRLRQILLNLIGNAMKFTDRGEIFVGIELLKMDHSHIELAFHVRDTGIGVPPDKLSRLFKAFSQVDSSTTRKYGGTGLGLVISQRLVELMGGSIAVESEVGVGTSFGFTIKGEVSQESIRQYVHTNITGNEGKKVLVVDDNRTNLNILKGQLEQWKLVPTLASSGAEALQILESSENFDLVITDMQMPDMDGVQLTNLIKANHAYLPVVLLSSIGDESKKNHPDLFAAVLNKPVKQQQFSRVLHSVLRTGDEGVLVEEKKSKQVLSTEFAERYPLRILVAEDNPVNQKLTTRVLNKLGYMEIVIAPNGLEAVERFHEQFYDVILMDVQMPEMDGLEATRLIRAKQYHQPYIISMTANAMQGDREICMQAGMDDYVSKPIKLEAVIVALEKGYEFIHRKVEEE
ncbi:hybrid sensor histidine kinase/response regulator [Parachryseolinea silvisoli]|uniref:hybrid sensor histidine kinase/response regulator n=1 Tax=Parachryseolinea silvisoli TaxID=2873601 RepID=UPI002265EEDB|nr:hybrid sensor histidine kinase/response regulator [Parachryseolinea silvisoli]MCD9015687.1 response regulator [Parachryseolinea silvisoli]